MFYIYEKTTEPVSEDCPKSVVKNEFLSPFSVIFVNKNENENVEKRENNKFVNENPNWNEKWWKLNNTKMRK